MGPVDRVADNARRAADRQARRPWRDKFPAVITAVDTGYSPPRYAWYEQTWDANGNRVRKVGGRFGSAANSPAYAFGDGSVLPAGGLPMPVTLRRRLTVRGLGAVYEFPLYCGCVAGAGSGGSGAGSGAGSVLVSCCSNPIPRTLTATFTAPTVPCVDGRAFTLTWSSGLGQWFYGTANHEISCGTGLVTEQYQFTLFCFGSSWTFGIGHTIAGDPTTASACNFSGPSYVPATSVCHPLFLEFTGTMVTRPGFLACSAGGKPFTITITE